MTQTDYTLPASECLEYIESVANDCSGPVEYRMAMSATGTQFPRCDKHYAERVETQRGIVSRYGGSMFYDGGSYGEDDY